MEPSSFLHKIVQPSGESTTSNNTTRAVVIISALAAITSIGYLIYRSQQTPPPPSLPQEPPTLDPSPRALKPGIMIEENAIRTANTTRTLTDDECFSANPLSAEKAAISKKMEGLSDLVFHIKSKSDYEQQVALAALLVILGIKPVLVFERNFEETDLHNILKNYLKDHPQYKLEKFLDIDFEKKPHESYCFSNESPLENFNPRRFLKPLKISSLSLNKTTIHCFKNQGNQKTDQMLSYLLGFGPSFEIYYQRVGRRFDPSKSVFSDAHYEQIGQVFSEENSKEVGIYIHNSIVKQPRIPMRDEKLGIKNPHYPFPNRTDLEFEKILYFTGTSCAYSGISARTEYSQDSLSLKKWVLEEYFPKIYSDRIK